MHRSRVFKGAISLLAFFVFATVVFPQVDVPRRTTAITYPLDEQVFVQFRGTTRFPRMKGEAKIRRTGRNGTVVELSVSKMPRPFELGAGYATYVLWAVSPEGQIDRLGEIKRRGFFEFDSKMTVTTPLQTFALIVTAEPHFLVGRPSQAIMLENLSPYGASGKSLATTASIQYFGNSSDYFRDSRTPEIAEIDYSKTPSAILQAKQAVALAKYAGAERDAADEMREAEDLLKTAEESWRAGRDEESVDIAARKAISASVKAEATAAARKEAREKRNEKARADAETRKAEDRITDAQSQIAELKAQVETETRNRQLSERDVQNYLTQLREVREENGRLREELGRVRVENDTVKAKITALENEKLAAEQQRAKEQRMASLASSESSFVQSLRRYGSVAKTERGIVLTLPESYWAGPRETSFATAAEPKLASLGEFLAANPDYRIVIESHTDDRGTADELQNLTQQRSQALSERFSGVGVAPARIEAKGVGAALPVAPNTTTANRARNRRVQLILVPNIE
jgi:outer membrane protein OmpA-like peptidoglycan-associated protein